VGDETVLTSEGVATEFTVMTGALWPASVAAASTALVIAVAKASMSAELLLALTRVLRTVSPDTEAPDGTVMV